MTGISPPADEPGQPRPALRGRVEWFNDQKGYGFIRAESGEEFFVHYTAIVGTGFRSLSEGDAVEFEVVDARHGRQAANVRKLPREA